MSKLNINVSKALRYKIKANSIKANVVIKVLRNHCYLLCKIGESKAPMQTLFAADYMKPWIQEDDYDVTEDDYDESEDGEDG